MLGTHPHSPTHLRLDGQVYWLSASTLNHAPLLDDTAKEIWRDTLKELATGDGIRLYAWVVPDTHYHLLVRLDRGDALPGFVQSLNGRSSRAINLAADTMGRKIWYQYWDRCIRGESDFYTRLNYLHHNPVKHGYVAKAEDYAFSSIHYFKRKYGVDWLHSLWERYPVVDFTPEEGD